VAVGAFIAAITPINGTSYVFTYSADAGSWRYGDADVDLADYGLSLHESVLPVDGETITVKYSEAPMAEYDTVQVMACVVGFGLSEPRDKPATMKTVFSDLLNTATWWRISTETSPRMWGCCDADIKP
jgi:hypothetical protein